ncbi:D-alanyl-D-alanine carboxypeptidase family protein [Amycolatopsis vancoresmycina]|uniref:D-alanyl-D-alanine carboxypeptidase n=1 Tax=Amycolatopsis vancoresmycina DSM 44592 TaxID=1292037 RepID=R1IFX5_9PSEU|nr:D-alanyl-D-alanine carboxypeptidase family protein [Amycolatopsis vancoresmycina]EOD69319.1 D-alanyl-D-alanine carboxypeptidase [Amycolatopsis vancoresmycina DSM 44592]
MHSVVSRSLQVFTTTLAAALLAMSTPALAAAAPPAGQCANHQAPPPPVDTSEKPAPGKQAPPPLAVPAVPVGGPRMAECGLITPDGALNPPDGNTAASWVVQDLDSGAIVAAKDPHARQRPASLIKTLLALLVVTQLQPQQTIVATKEDAEQECTCVGLVAGGQYTVDQLLHGLLMHSGNDVAHAFATALGGVDATVAKMNALAAKIGALDTRAATPSGLDGPGMSTSAYDLSLIFHYAMKQPEFASVVATKNFEIPAAGGKPAVPIFNDNKLLGVYPGFLGGKTGFTDDARHTYVGAAQRQGKRLAVVMLRAEQKPTKVVDQAAKLLDYGFALEEDRAVPVGQITYQAPAATSENGDPSVLADGGTGNGGTSATASSAKEDPFGVTGWIITLVVFLVIVGGFVVGHQRKRATR